MLQGHWKADVWTLRGRASCDPWICALQWDVNGKNTHSYHFTWIPSLFTSCLQAMYASVFTLLPFSSNRKLCYRCSINICWLCEWTDTWEETVKRQDCLLPTPIVYKIKHESEASSIKIYLGIWLLFSTLRNFLFSKTALRTCPKWNPCFLPFRPSWFSNVLSTILGKVLEWDLEVCSAL